MPPISTRFHEYFSRNIWRPNSRDSITKLVALASRCGPVQTPRYASPKRTMSGRGLEFVISPVNEILEHLHDRSLEIDRSLFYED